MRGTTEIYNLVHTTYLSGRQTSGGVSYMTRQKEKITHHVEDQKFLLINPRIWSKTGTYQTLSPQDLLPLPPGCFSRSFARRQTIKRVNRTHSTTTP